MLREYIVTYCQAMVKRGLTTGTGGNISVRDPERGVIAISPSGVEYDRMRPLDVPLVDMDGAMVQGPNKPSSELGFHLALYRARPDIAAVVHTHSVYATTMACLRLEIPAAHYLVGFAGKKVPLCEYATFGTPELAEVIASSIGQYNAMLLANHGLVAVGRDIGSAFAAAEEVEFVARVYYQAKTVGDPVILPDEEMDVVIEKFKTYGQKG